MMRNPHEHTDTQEVKNRQEAVEAFTDLREFLKQAAPQGIHALQKVKQRIDDFSARFCNYRVNYLPGCRNKYAAKDGSWKIYLSKIEGEPHYYLEAEEPKEWKEADEARVQGMIDERYSLLRLQFGERIGLAEISRFERVEFTLTENTSFLTNKEHGGCGISLPKGTRLRKKAGCLPGTCLGLEVPALGISFDMPDEFFPKEGCPAKDIAIDKDEQK